MREKKTQPETLIYKVNNNKSWVKSTTFSNDMKWSKSGQQHEKKIVK